MANFASAACLLLCPRPATCRASAASRANLAGAARPSHPPAADLVTDRARAPARPCPPSKLVKQRPSRLHRRRRPAPRSRTHPRKADRSSRSRSRTSPCSRPVWKSASTRPARRPRRRHVLDDAHGAPDTLVEFIDDAENGTSNFRSMLTPLTTSATASVRRLEGVTTTQPL